MNKLIIIIPIIVFLCMRKRDKSIDLSDDDDSISIESNLIII